MSRKPSNFVALPTSYASSSIFSRFDDWIDRVAARKFRFARVRVSVSRTPVAQRHRLTRHTRKVGYLVSTCAKRENGGGNAGVWKGRKRERTRKRTHSNVNRTLVRFAAQRRSHQQRCLTAPSGQSGPIHSSEWEPSSLPSQRNI